MPRSMSWSELVIGGTRRNTLRLVPVPRSWSSNPASWQKSSTRRAASFAGARVSRSARQRAALALAHHDRGLRFAFGAGIHETLDRTILHKTRRLRRSKFVLVSGHLSQRMLCVQRAAYSLTKRCLWVP